MKFDFIDRWNNIMYMWSNGLLETLPNSYADKISPKSLLKKTSLIFKNLFADFLRFFKTTDIPESKIWFLILSHNNFEALKKIQLNVPDSVFVSFFRFRSSVSGPPHYFHLRYRILHDIIYPFKWLIYFMKCTKKAIRYFDLLFTVNGTYEEFLRLLKNKRPKAIVFTNDHLVIARSLLLAANKLGIKTYYVQHASITEHFPPLEFSYALLDGEDAYLKYKQCGNINSEVKLVGISKFDSYINNVNNNKRIYNVGVAFNLVDEIESVEKTIVKIKENHPDLKLIVRPHPAEQRSLKLFNDVYISNSTQENSFDFIKKIDCLISGDSSIHLEAVLLNVYSCYYNFNVSQRFDYYGFVKNGLIEYIKNIEDLNNRLTELKVFKPDTQKKSKFYNEAIDTDYYGNSTNKISEIIIDTLKIENDKK